MNLPPPPLTSTASAANTSTHGAPSKIKHMLTTVFSPNLVSDQPAYHSSFMNESPRCVEIHGLIESDLAALIETSDVDKPTPIRLFEPSRVLAEIEQVEDDAHCLLPASRVRDGSIVSVSASARMSSGETATSQSLYSGLATELLSLATHPLLEPFIHALARTICFNTESTRALIEGRKAGLKRGKVRAQSIEKWIQQVMQAYQIEDEITAFQANASPDNKPSDLSARLAAAMSKGKKGARSVSAILQQVSGASSVPRPMPFLQHLGMNTLVETGLIFLNAIQQHDPHVLAQILTLVRSTMLSLPQAGALSNWHQGFLAKQGVHSSSIRSLQPVFEYFGKLIASIPVQHQTAQALIAPAAPSSPFGNLLAVDKNKPTNSSNQLLPPSLRKKVQQNEDSSSSISSSTSSTPSTSPVFTAPPLTPQSIRAQCIEVSLLWSLARAQLPDVIRWMTFLLQSDCIDDNGKFVIHPLSNVRYNLVPFQSFLGQCCYSVEEEQEAQAARVRDCIHSAFEADRNTVHQARLKAVRKELHHRRKVMNKLRSKSNNPIVARFSRKKHHKRPADKTDQKLSRKREYCRNNGYSLNARRCMRRQDRPRRRRNDSDEEEEEESENSYGSEESDSTSYSSSSSSSEESDMDSDSDISDESSENSAQGHSDPEEENLREVRRFLDSIDESSSENEVESSVEDEDDDDDEDDDETEEEEEQKERPRDLFQRREESKQESKEREEKVRDEDEISIASSSSSKRARGQSRHHREEAAEENDPKDKDSDDSDWDISEDEHEKNELDESQRSNREERKKHDRGEGFEQRLHGVMFLSHMFAEEEEQAVLENRQHALVQHTLQELTEKEEQQAKQKREEMVAAQTGVAQPRTFQTLPALILREFGLNSLALQSASQSSQSSGYHNVNTTTLVLYCAAHLDRLSSKLDEILSPLPVVLTPAQQALADKRKKEEEAAEAKRKERLKRLNSRRRKKAEEKHRIEMQRKEAMELSKSGTSRSASGLVDPLVLCCNEENFECMMELVELLVHIYLKPPPINSQQPSGDSNSMTIPDYYSLMYILLSMLRLLGRHLCAIQQTLTEEDPLSKLSKFISPLLIQRVKNCIWQLFVAKPSAPAFVRSPSDVDAKQLEADFQLMKSSLRNVLQSILSDAYEVLYSTEIGPGGKLQFIASGLGDADGDNKSQAGASNRSNKLFLLGDIIDMWQQEELESSVSVSLTSVLPASSGSFFPSLLSSFLSSTSPSFLPSIHSFIQSLLPASTSLSPLWQSHVSNLCQVIAPRPKKTKKKKHSDDDDDYSDEVDSDVEEERRREEEEEEKRSNQESNGEVSMDLSRPFRNLFEELSLGRENFNQLANELMNKQEKAQYTIQRMMQLFHRAAKDLRNSSRPAAAASTSTNKAAASASTSQTSAGITIPVNLASFSTSNASYDLFNRPTVDAMSTSASTSSSSTAASSDSDDPVLDVEAAPWFPSLLSFFQTLQSLLFHTTSQTLKLHRRLELEKRKKMENQSKDAALSTTPTLVAPSVSAVSSSSSSSTSSVSTHMHEDKQREEKQREEKIPDSDEEKSTPGSIASESELQSQIEVTKRYVLDFLNLFLAEDAAGELIYFTREEKYVPAVFGIDGGTVGTYELSNFSFVLLRSLLHPLLLSLSLLTELDAVPLIASLLPTLQRLFEKIHSQWLRTLAMQKRVLADVIPQRIRQNKKSSVEPSDPNTVHILSEPTPTVWLAANFFPAFASILSHFSRALLTAMPTQAEYLCLEEFNPFPIEEHPGDRLKEEDFKRAEKKKLRELVDEPAILIDQRIEEWINHTRLLQGGLTAATMMKPLPSSNRSSAFVSASSYTSELNLHQLRSVLQEQASLPNSACAEFLQRFRVWLPWNNQASSTSESATSALEEANFLNLYFNHSPSLTWFTQLLAIPPPKGSALAGLKPPVQRLQKSIVELAAKASQLYFCVLIKHLCRVHLCVREERIRFDRERKLAALHATFKDAADIPSTLMPPAHDSAPARLITLYYKSLEIQGLFARVKGSGGDVEALYEQIRERAQFLCFECEPTDESRIQSILASFLQPTAASSANATGVTQTPSSAVRSGTPLSPGFHSISPLISPSGQTVQFASTLTLTPTGPRVMSAVAPSSLTPLAIPSSRDNSDASDQLPAASPAPTRLVRAPSKWIKAKALIRLLSHTLGAVVRLKRLLCSRKLLASTPLLPPATSSNVTSLAGDHNPLLTVSFKHLEHELQITQAAFVFLTQDYDALVASKKKKSNNSADDSGATSKSYFNRLFLSHLRSRMQQQSARAVWRMFGLFMMERLSSYLIDSSIEDPESEWHASHLRRAWMAQVDEKDASSSTQAHFSNPAASLVYNTPRVMLNYTLLTHALAQLRVPANSSSFLNSVAVPPHASPLLLQQFTQLFQKLFSAANQLRPSHAMFSMLNFQILQMVNYLPSTGEYGLASISTSTSTSSVAVQPPSTAVTSAPSVPPSPSLSSSTAVATTREWSISDTTPVASAYEWHNWRIINKHIEGLVQSPLLTSAYDATTWFAPTTGSIPQSRLLNSHMSSWELRFGAWALYRLQAYRACEIFARLSVEAAVVTQQRLDSGKSKEFQQKQLQNSFSTPVKSSGSLSNLSSPSLSASNVSSSPLTIADAHPSKLIVLDVLRFVHRQLVAAQTHRRALRTKIDALSDLLVADFNNPNSVEPEIIDESKFTRGFLVCFSCFFIQSNVNVSACEACSMPVSLQLRPVTDTRLFDEADRKKREEQRNKKQASNDKPKKKRESKEEKETKSNDDESKDSEADGEEKKTSPKRLGSLNKKTAKKERQADSARRHASASKRTRDSDDEASDAEDNEDEDNEDEEDEEDIEEDDEDENDEEEDETEPSSIVESKEEKDGTDIEGTTTEEEASDDDDDDGSVEFPLRTSRAPVMTAEAARIRVDAQPHMVVVGDYLGQIRYARDLQQADVSVRLVIRSIKMDTDGFTQKITGSMKIPAHSHESASPSGTVEFTGTNNTRTGAMDLHTAEQSTGDLILPCRYQSRVSVPSGQQQMVGTFANDIDEEYKGTFNAHLDYTTVREDTSSQSGKGGDSKFKNERNQRQSTLDEFFESCHLGDCMTAAYSLDAHAPNNPLVYYSEQQLECLPRRTLFSFYLKRYQELSLYVNQCLWLLLRMVHTHSAIIEKCLPLIASLTGVTEDRFTSKYVSDGWVGMIVEFLFENVGVTDEPRAFEFHLKQKQRDAAEAEAKKQQEERDGKKNKKTKPESVKLSNRMKLRFENPLAWITRVLSFRLLRLILPVCNPSSIELALKSSTIATTSNVNSLYSMFDRCLELIGLENMRPLETSLHSLPAARDPFVPPALDKKRAKNMSSIDKKEREERYAKNMQRRSHFALLNRCQSVAEESVSFLRLLLGSASSERDETTNASLHDLDEEDGDNEFEKAPSSSSTALPHQTNWKRLIFQQFLKHLEQAPAALASLAGSVGSLRVIKDSTWEKSLFPTLSKHNADVVQLFGVLSVLGGYLPVLREGSVVEVHQTLLDINREKKEGGLIGATGASGAISARLAASTESRTPHTPHHADSSAGDASGDAATTSAAAADASGTSNDAHVALVIGLYYQKKDEDEDDASDDSSDSDEDDSDAQENERIVYVQLTNDGERYEIESDSIEVVPEIAVPTIVSSTTPRSNDLFDLALQFLDAFGALFTLSPDALLVAHPQFSLLLLQLHRRILQILPNFLLQKSLVEHWMNSNDRSYNTDSKQHSFAKHVAQASLNLIDAPADLIASLTKNASNESQSNNNANNAALPTLRPSRAHWESYLASLDRWRPMKLSPEDSASSSKPSALSAEIKAIQEELRMSGFQTNTASQSPDGTDFKEIISYDPTELVSASPVESTKVSDVFDVSHASKDLYAMPLSRNATASDGDLSNKKPEAWKSAVNARELRAYHQGRVHQPPPSSSTSPSEAHAVAELPPLLAARAPRPLRIVPYMGERNGSASELTVGSGNYNMTSVDNFATYVPECLLLTSGRWYWVCQIVQGSIHQLGVATPQFRVRPSKDGIYYGAGDDNYSWIYDGSRRVCYHGVDAGPKDFATHFTWKSGDRIGFGLDIDSTSNRAKMTVWGNGKRLGVAYNDIDSTQGLFPAFSIDGPGAVKVFLHPSEFGNCPLPAGYKPLVVPSLDTNVPLVTYPTQAFVWNSASTVNREAAKQEASDHSTDSDEKEEKESNQLDSPQALDERKEDSISSSSSSSSSSKREIRLNNLVEKQHAALLSTTSNSAATEFVTRLPYPNVNYNRVARTSSLADMRVQTGDAPIPLDEMADGLTISFSINPTSASSGSASSTFQHLVKLETASHASLTIAHSTEFQQLQITSTTEHGESVTQELTISTSAASSISHKAQSQIETEDEPEEAKSPVRFGAAPTFGAGLSSFIPASSMMPPQLSGIAPTSIFGATTVTLATPLFGSAPVNGVEQQSSLFPNAVPGIDLFADNANVSNSFNWLEAPTIPSIAAPEFRTMLDSIEEKDSKPKAETKVAASIEPHSQTSLAPALLHHDEMYLVFHQASEEEKEFLEVFINNHSVGKINTNILAQQLQFHEEHPGNASSDMTLQLQLPSVAMPTVKTVAATPSAVSSSSSSSSSAPAVSPISSLDSSIPIAPPLTKPRLPIVDRGYADALQVWVDLQNQGVANDYARWVGPGETPSGVFHPERWLSVALAGASNEYTEPGVFVVLSDGVTVAKGPNYKKLMAAAETTSSDASVALSSGVGKTKIPSMLYSEPCYEIGIWSHPLSSAELSSLSTGGLQHIFEDSLEMESQLESMKFIQFSVADAKSRTLKDGARWANSAYMGSLGEVPTPSSKSSSNSAGSGLPISSASALLIDCVPSSFEAEGSYSVVMDVRVLALPKKSKSDEEVESDKHRKVDLATARLDEINSASTTQSAAAATSGNDAAQPEPMVRAESNYDFDLFGEGDIFTNFGAAYDAAERGSNPLAMLWPHKEDDQVILFHTHPSSSSTMQRDAHVSLLPDGRLRMNGFPNAPVSNLKVSADSTKTVRFGFVKTDSSFTVYVDSIVYLQFPIEQYSVNDMNDQFAIDAKEIQLLKVVQSEEVSSETYQTVFDSAAAFLKSFDFRTLFSEDKKSTFSKLTAEEFALLVELSGDNPKWVQTQLEKMVSTDERFATTFAVLSKLAFIREKETSEVHSETEQSTAEASAAGTTADAESEEKKEQESTLKPVADFNRVSSGNTTAVAATTSNESKQDTESAPTLSLSPMTVAPVSSQNPVFELSNVILYTYSVSTNQLLPKSAIVDLSRTSLVLAGLPSEFLGAAANSVVSLGVDAPRSSSASAEASAILCKIEQPQVKQRQVLAAIDSAQNKNPYKHVLGRSYASVDHEHELEYKSDCGYSAGYFSCDLCSRSGSEEVYHCSLCNYDNHPHCFRPRNEVDRNLHKHVLNQEYECTSHMAHKLKYLNRITNPRYFESNFSCNICGVSSTPPVYHCSICAYDAHPACLQIQSVTEMSKVVNAPSPNLIAFANEYSPPLNLSYIVRYAESHKSLYRHQASLLALSARASLLCRLHPSFTKFQITKVLGQWLNQLRDVEKKSTDGKSTSPTEPKMTEELYEREVNCIEQIVSELWKALYDLRAPAGVSATHLVSAKDETEFIKVLSQHYNPLFLANFLAPFSKLPKTFSVNSWFGMNPYKGSDKKRFIDEMVWHATGLTQTQTDLVRGEELGKVDWSEQVSNVKTDASSLPQPVSHDWASHDSLTLQTYFDARRNTERGLIALYARELIIHSLAVWNAASKHQQPQSNVHSVGSPAAAAAATSNGSNGSADDDALPPMNRSFSGVATSAPPLGGPRSLASPLLVRSVSVQAASSTFSFPFASFGSIAFLPRLLRLLDYEQGAPLLGDASTVAPDTGALSAMSRMNDSQQMQQTIRSIVIGEIFQLESSLYADLVQQFHRGSQGSISGLQSGSGVEFDKDLGPTPALVDIFQKEAPICAQLLKEAMTMLLVSMFHPTLLTVPDSTKKKDDGEFGSKPASATANKSASDAPSLAAPSPRFILFVVLLFFDRLSKIKEQTTRLQSRGRASTEQDAIASKSKKLTLEALSTLLFPQPFVQALFTFMIIHPSTSVRLTFMRLLIKLMPFISLTQEMFQCIHQMHKAIEVQINDSKQEKQLTPIQTAVFDLYHVALFKVPKNAPAPLKKSTSSSKAREESSDTSHSAPSASMDVTIVDANSDNLPPKSSPMTSRSNSSLSKIAMTPEISITKLMNLTMIMRVVLSDVNTTTPASSAPPATSSQADLSNYSPGFLSKFMDSIVQGDVGKMYMQNRPTATAPAPRHSLWFYADQYLKRAPANAVRLYQELTAYVNVLVQQFLSGADSAKHKLKSQAGFLQAISRGMRKPKDNSSTSDSLFSEDSTEERDETVLNSRLDTAKRAVAKQKDNAGASMSEDNDLKDVLMNTLDEGVNGFPLLSVLEVHEFVFHVMVLFELNELISNSLELFDLTVVPSGPSNQLTSSQSASSSSAVSSSGPSSATSSYAPSVFALEPTAFATLHTSFHYDLLFKCKGILFTHLKDNWLTTSMVCTSIRYSGSMSLDTFRASKAQSGSLSFANVRKSLFGQAFKQIYKNSHLLCRTTVNNRAWSVSYIGLHASDAGGPYRESINDMMKELQSDVLPFFVPVPNAKAGTGSHRDCFVTRPYFVRPPPFSNTEQLSPQMKRTYQLRKQCYRFIGQLMGLAIRSKNLLPLNLPPLVWRLLVQEEITLKHVEEIDVLSFSLIHDMMKQQQKIKNAAASSSSSSTSVSDETFLFDSIMSELKFEVTGADGVSYELMPGGRDIGLTSSNWQQYVSLVRQFRLHEFDAEAAEIRIGLSSVIPPAILQLYSWKELRLLVVGTGTIDIELLKRMTSVSSSLENTDTIRWFWHVLKNRFTPLQQSQFLTFVWGRSVLPSKESDFERKMNVQLLREGSNPDMNLPVSHTCFFGIDLPMYTKEEILYSKLLYAVENCTSIDGDSSIQTRSGADSDDEENEFGYA